MTDVIVTWLISAYAVLLFVLTGAAGWVALFATDHERSARAHQLVKLLLTLVCGSSGLLALVLRLHQVGLI